MRSVRGPRGRWFRELLARRTGAVHVGARRIPVRATRVSSAATIAHVSEAIRTKYRTSKASVRAMVRPAVLATTAKLEPA